MCELTLAQREWFFADERTASEQKRFLVVSEPSYRAVPFMESNEMVYIPTLRSVTVRRNDSQPFYLTPEEAIAEGRAIRREWLSEVADEQPLDERALGIDGTVAWQMHEARSAAMRVEHVAHIGNMLAVGDRVLGGTESTDALVEFLLDPNGNMDDSMMAVLPPNAGALSALDADDAEDILRQHLMEEAVFGFAIEAATPVKKTLDGGRVRAYSWDTAARRWFYAETFDEAYSKATDWAKGVIAP